ncbi:MAG: caspase family protein [Spirochaetales bacterium]|nr:caspase family protein [Spirochaetales bacterium]
MKKRFWSLLFFMTFFNIFFSFTDEIKKTGKRWALIIGINNYQNHFLEPLSMPRYDAKLIEDTLKNEGKFDIVIRMTDDIFPNSPKYPSKKNIYKVLQQISDDIQENDNFLLFFSGYTIQTSDNKTNLLTIDSNLNNIENTSLPLSSVSDICTHKKLKNSMFFIDGYKISASIKVQHLLPGTNENTPFPKIQTTDLPHDSLIFQATSEKDFSVKNKQSIYTPYGVFAYYLCDGLKGAADFDNDNLVNIEDLITFVKQKIISWSLWRPEQQIPIENTVGDFDLQFKISSIPLIARPLFDPYKIDTSFYYQNLYFHLMNYISLGSFLTGLTIFASGITICAFGLSQIIGNNFTIENFVGTVKELFTSYNSIDNDLLKNGAFITVFGTLFTLVSFVPYFFSFHLDLNKTHNFQFSLVTGIKDSYFRVGISLKTKKI